MAENWSLLQSLQETLTHPTNVRAAYNEDMKAMERSINAPLVDASLHIETPEAARQATREQVWKVKGRVLKVIACP